MPARAVLPRDRQTPRQNHQAFSEDRVVPHSCESSPILYPSDFRSCGGSCEAHPSQTVHRPAQCPLWPTRFPTALYCLAARVSILFDLEQARVPSSSFDTDRCPERPFTELNIFQSDV